MKQSTEHASTTSPQSDSRRDGRRPSLAGFQPPSGRLTQMSALMNGSARVHSLTQMGQWMNQGAPGGEQPARLEASTTGGTTPVGRPGELGPAPGAERPPRLSDDGALEMEHEAGGTAGHSLQQARRAQASASASTSSSASFMPAQRAASVGVSVVQREGDGLLGPVIPGGAERYLMAEPEQQPVEPGRARDLQHWNTELQAQQQQHVVNQQAVYAVVNAPTNLANLVDVPDLNLPVELILANTKQYIRRNVALMAMTQTLSTRLKPPREFERVWGPRPDEAAKGELFFDDNTLYPVTGSNRKAAEGMKKTDAGVVVREDNESAHAQNINIRIFMDRPLNVEELKGTLIHELQHMLDSHSEMFRESVIQDVNRKAGDVANSYRSEFRAYWLEDADGSKFGSPALPALNASPVVEKWWVFNWRSQATAFANRRQERIFWHLANCGTYPWVKPNYLQSAAFRAVVNGLTTPTGGNLINSLRIHALSSTLTLASPSFAFYTQDVINEAHDLQGLDLLYLRSAQAAPFWTFFDARFNGPFENDEQRDRVALIKQHLEEIIGRP